MAQKKKKSPSKSKPATKQTPNKSVSSENSAVKKAKETIEKVNKSVDGPSTQSQGSKGQVRIMKPNFKKFLLYLVMILVTLIAVDFIVQYINNGYSVAIVNGHRIPRSEYEMRLEEAYGEVIATQLVNEQLIQEEAAKEEVTVSEDEVQEIVDETVESVGGQEAYESLLAANGLTEEAYKRNLRLQLLAEQLVVSAPSEEELLAFYEENKELYTTEDDKKWDEVEFTDIREQVEEVYTGQMFNQNSSAWLSNLREQSKIQNNVSEEPSFGLLKITRELISDLNNRLNKE